MKPGALVLGMVLALDPAAHAQDTNAAPHPHTLLGTDLVLACQVGDVAEAQKLIAQGAPVNTAGSNHGITPLLLASMRSVELVKLLLDHGAQVNLADADGFTPINDACYTGKADIVVALLDASANPNLANNYGKTPLMNAASRGDDAIVAALLAHHADPNEATSFLAPIWWAMAQNHPSTVKLLLDAGAPANQLPPGPERPRNTLLEAAADKSEIDVVTVLLAGGANANQPGDDAYTPLISAVRSGSTPETIQLLLDKGADVNAQNADGETALMLATRYEKPPVLQMLLDHGARPELRDNAGRTALIWACYETYPPAVDVLVGHGVDVNAADKRGETPLSYAADRGYSDVVQTLMSKGADPALPRIIARAKPNPPLEPAQAWALAVGAIYAQANGENYFKLGYQDDADPQEARRELKDDWNVTDQASLLKIVDNLRTQGQRIEMQSLGAEAALSNGATLALQVANLPPERRESMKEARTSFMRWKERTGLAWDLCRCTNMLNAGVAAGYIDADQAWPLLLGVARQVQEAFGSWKEMSENFLDGRAVAVGQRDPRFRACASLLLNAKDANSPWNQLPWKTDLGKE